MSLFSSAVARASSCAALVLLVGAVGVSRADTVVRKDGVRIEGDVVSVDPTSVVVETRSGRVTLPRAEVASIAFAGAKPLKVEIKNVLSDDAIDVTLDGEDVIHSASTGGEWIDITPKLKDGNNALRLRIHNARGVWAYRLLLRVNGQTTSLECGTPQGFGKGCTTGGHSGNEIGTIDDLPEIWLNVDRSAGRAEILR
ncbi:MAG TPA: hypothetical protein VMR65_01210 [Candidatus Sulfotelmatobacter sp.]|jgi:hypothetical protein|nr:hypothetical protein [Candidatus Sulfotelmatobacter sp.]